MNEILKRDQNRITVLAGVTDDVDKDITMLRVDPITKRLLVSATGIAAGVTSLNGLTGDVILAAGTNITLVPAGNTITINSTASGGGMAIGGTVTSGTAGSILFVGSGPVLAQDNTNLFWNSGDHQIVWPKFNSLSTTSQAAVGVTDANLVSLWHFDEGTGTTAADSIGSVTLTLNSASWTTANQLVGAAAATDYASATVTIPTNSAWTIMGWIYSTDYSQQKEIFASANSVGDGSPSFAVGTTSGTRQLQLYAAGNFATTNPMAISDGLWYHIAVTFDGTSTYKLYLDGVLNATRTATPSGNNSKLFIGSGFFGTLSGVRIDEWAYFNAALTQAQVQKYPLVSYVNKGGIFSEKFLIKDSNDFIYVNANPSNGFFTISGNSDNTARGPLVIKSKATGSGLGVGFNIDASPLTNGKNYSFVSTGNLSSPGAGAFAVYDSTAGAYPWVMLSSYHLNFATNFFNDIAQVTIIPTSSSTVGNIIRGASSQSADLTEWQNNGGTILSVVDKDGNLGLGTSLPSQILSLGGNTARTIWMERHTTSNTAGNNLIFQAGGATAGATNKNSGILKLGGQLATGSGQNETQILGTNGVNNGSTTDVTPAVMIDVINNKIGFYTATPVIQPATSGTTTGFTPNTSVNPVFNESTFTGGLGSTAYTVSDIVLALKQLGILAQ